MKYRRFVLLAYNEQPMAQAAFAAFGDDCFHCEIDTKGLELTESEFIDKYIKPAALVIFSACIPPMPDVVKDPHAFTAWELKYYGHAQDLAALRAMIEADLDADEMH